MEKKNRFATLANNFLGCLLRDNQMAFGGTEHSLETLDEFLDSLDMAHDSDMEEVNIALADCGIEPIPYVGMKNCRLAVRFPENHEYDIEENGTEIYFANPNKAFESAHKLKEKYNEKEIEVEDIFTNVKIATVEYC